LNYQHATRDRDKSIAAGLGRLIERRGKPSDLAHRVILVSQRLAKKALISESG
jgi:hypothetical protein